MKRIVRDFVTLFNMLWYRDFPVAVNVKEMGSRAEWTTHIGICVRSAADLMGYFTHFEAGNRTDAVIKNAQNKGIANVEWEWTQPHKSTFNELDKLRASRDLAVFSVLITYSRSDHHELNLERIRSAWSNCEEPLLLFLVCFDFSKGRQFSTLDTYLAQRGIVRKLRSQPALPWNLTGTRWALTTS
ncbi:hypothetical protein [Burkholderia ubonensis]|uniref:Uncharacterized protein n=1 Tax=Burkholderia ubonensis TaxID=101571 RepID=A0A107G1H9_9BURK|nr:hypothetical protein [Burkholderia ubonensis]KWD80580.1 hypothetical protein WL71_20255 [Burkholderia ubonensis]KWD86499.1 hypothetical protein WL70_10625 [Burkholderia ubonensis]KWE03578.1 hypothetical protein WL72_04215 [Burkholderia ubonensis]KWE12719.1 hypothetical protein WL73_31480 [Burkholderia ubonensis]